VVVNKHLIKDLLQLGLWNNELKNKIVFHNGSIQVIHEIPDSLKRIYKTAWELKQKTLIDQAVDRGKYICQSQSLNLFISKPTIKMLSSMHFYAWKKGLKTGMYYLRTQPAAAPVQFTIAPCESCSS
jgi:ribonucleoside-diphosphate reductase alpha chain